MKIILIMKKQFIINDKNEEDKEEDLLISQQI